MTDVLWASFANAVKVGEEADALLDALGDLLSEGGLSAHFIDLDSEVVESWPDNKDGWVESYYLLEWKLKTRPDGKSAGFLTVALSFWRPEDQQGKGWAGANLAKLYVAFCPRRSPAWDSETLVLDASGHSAQAQPSSDFTWESTAAGSRSGGWFFCVRCSEIQGRDDLVREVLTPLDRLLADVPIEAAFEGTVAALRTPSLKAVA